MGLYSGDLRDLVARDMPGYAFIRRVVEFDRKLGKGREASEYLVTVYVDDCKSANVVACLTFPGKHLLSRRAEAVR